LPYLNIHYSEDVINKNEIVAKLSKFVSEELNKPERYVMISFNTDVCMSLGSNKNSLLFIEFKSIGFKKDVKKISEALCRFMEKELKVNKDRIYIVFSDIDRSMWGWNGTTFESI
jgi:phenylpyruvate tautomerase PptA (4-oxalocrotonate tautomerase family)